MQSTIKLEKIIKILKENGVFQSKNLINGDELITGTVKTDSRKVIAGDVFVAIKGFVSDGHFFIGAAVKNGAALVITEDFISCGVPQIKVSDCRKAAALIINAITGNPTSKLKLIGVTGTNGKTTTSFIIGNIFKQLKIKYGIIGTLGFYIEDEFFPTKLTTPDILDLNHIFLKMLNEGVEVVVMEVSAHAVSLMRICGLEFDVACFTNLSRDHLDFYQTMDKYYNAKRFFVESVAGKGGKVLINVEDEWGAKLYQIVRGEKYSLGSHNCDFCISNEVMKSSAGSFNIDFSNETTRVNINLAGRYNIRNAAMALIAVHLAYPHITCKDVDLSNLDFVPGRLERITTSDGVTVFIDYAHTPDALEKVLENIREFVKGRIITISGAGGDRDKGKRPEMLDKALRNSDFVIVTNDNPRYENPNAIIDDIVGNTSIDENFWIVRDRKLAIETAIKLAQKKDVVLIAGKGHEDYQEIGGIRHPFSDKEVALNYHNTSCNCGMLSVFIDLVMLKKILEVDFRNDENFVFKHVSTDSRNVKSNTIFFALKGERYDGHNYIEEVLEDSTNWAVVSRRINHPRCIYVSDTLKAYGKLAKKYLNVFNVKRIGITGSAGKTTTKEFVSLLLSQKYNTHKTHANENNLIGLPKTIFKLKTEHQAVVFELGSNHPGEIEQLSEICRPDIGIITFIGPSHLEFFTDLKGVFKEKTSMFKYTKSAKIFNGDEPLFEENGIEGISIGYNSGNQYQVEIQSIDEDGIKITLNSIEYMINTKVPYLAFNAAMAIVCSELSGLSQKEIQEGLKESLVLKNRMQLIHKDNRIIISDCYNANPISMKSALKFWRELHKDLPHIAFLGDMLELGDTSVKYHKEIAEFIDNPKEIITIGHFSREFQAAIHFDNIERLIDTFDFTIIPKECVILLKASNSIRLHMLLEKL